MNKKKLAVFLVSGLSLLFLSAALHAGTEVVDVITMDYSPYEKRMFGEPKRNFVEFPHAMHIDELNISCGDTRCHHIDVEEGDEVKPCVECHLELKATAKNRKSLMLHRNAMHESCIACHKEHNREMGDPRGVDPQLPPTACSECHTKVDAE